MITHRLASVLMTGLFMITFAPIALCSELRFEVPLSQESLRDAYVEIWPASAVTSTRLKPRVVTTSSLASTLAVLADCDPTTRFVLHSPSIVSEAFSPMDTSCGEIQRVRVFRSAHISGQLAGHSAPEPVRGSLAVTRCLDKQAVDRPLRLTNYPVIIDDTGDWGAVVPGECLDLQLTVLAYAPIEWTALHLGPNARSTLGVRFVYATASARVRVRDERDRPVPHIPVFAVDSSQWNLAIDGILRRDRPAHAQAAATDVDGVATIVGLKAGLFRFVAISDGQALGFSDVQVLDAGHLDLPRPLVLRQRRAISVRLERSRLGPSDEALEIAAHPLIAGRPAGMTGAVVSPVDDVASFDYLFPAAWRITVRSKHDSGFLQAVASADAILANSDIVVTLPLFATYFTGHILRGSSPVSGRVELIRASGQPGPRYSAVAGHDGVFRVQLPAPGKYHVVVVGDGQQETGAALDVSFDSADHIVDINLSDGAVSGIVLDAHGSPVPDAFATLVWRERDFLAGLLHRRTSTGADGTFSVTGLTDGEWSIEAADAFRVSEPQMVSVRSGSRSKVRLTLAERANAVGTVLTVDGYHVAGIAGVAYFETPAAPRLAQVVQFRTNGAGEFELNLPNPTPSKLNIQLYGYERGLMAVRVSPTERFEVRLPAATGSVVLQFEPQIDPQADPGDAVSRGQHVLVNDNGALIVPDLAMAHSQPISVSRADGGVIMRIPYLAPGRWQVIRLAPGDHVPWFVYRRGLDDVVAEFTITAGASQVVSVRP